MRTLKITLMSLFLLTVPMLVLAQDNVEPKTKVTGEAVKVEAKVPAAAPEAAATPAPASETAEHKKVDDLKPDATTEEVMEAAFATVEEAQKYFKDRDAAKESGTKKAFLWAAVLAALLKLLISLIRRTSPFWKKTRGKWVIRLITLTLGIGAGVLANLALGMPWWDAVTVFLGGPGAVLITEYQKMIPFLNPKKEKKED